MPLRPFQRLIPSKAVRRNAVELARFFLVLGGVVLLYAWLFQVVMRLAEGQRGYTWIDGLYWTLTTMSTVGFGDIVFTTAPGRLFSILVLLTGLVTLFVVLPFVFLRYFYTPLIEAQMRRRAPRVLPETTRGHVIICAYDKLAEGFIGLLEQERIPYYVIEPSPEAAANLYYAGVSVVSGEVDSAATYEGLRVSAARMVLANLRDAQNANITLTVREQCPHVPIVAIAHLESGVDVLAACGATHVVPVYQWLGEQLANRINTSRAQAHVVGKYHDLLVAELPVHQTPLVGKTIRDTQLREHTGLSIIGVWERGSLHPPHPDRALTSSSVPVLVGAQEQFEELDYLLAIYDYNPHPVVVVGGGPVGLAAARALERKEASVCIVERDESVYAALRNVRARVIHGDAMDAATLEQAGVRQAPSVLLTGADDATNVFLAALCRRLNPELRIVSRISHERNIETIHRAGADLVLGSASLGVQATFSLLRGSEIVVLGEGVDLFAAALPPALSGLTLEASRIRARTSLTVVAVEKAGGAVVTNPPSDYVFAPGDELLMFGTAEHRRRFDQCFNQPGRSAATPLHKLFARRGGPPGRGAHA